MLVAGGGRVETRTLTHTVMKISSLYISSTHPASKIVSVASITQCQAASDFLKWKCLCENDVI